jgi:RNA polymerase sigma-70 factor (ECF subfamily)
MVSVLSYPRAGASATMDSHEDLIARAITGDRFALDGLLRSLQRRVYLLAWRLVGDPVAAEDIAQEVLLKVALRLKKYRQGTNFWAWVARITVNQVHDHHRAEPRSVVLEHEPASPVRSTETAALLEQALGILSRKEREALVLTEIEGHTSSEAAAILGCLSVTVRVRAAHARKKLRKWLRPHFPERGREP